MKKNEIGIPNRFFLYPENAEDYFNKINQITNLEREYQQRTKSEVFLQGYDFFNFSQCRLFQDIFFSQHM